MLDPQNEIHNPQTHKDIYLSRLISSGSTSVKQCTPCFCLKDMKDLRKRYTKKRHNEVHQVNEDIKAELGHRVYWGLSRKVIYEMISERIGLSPRRIQFILDHTEKV